VSAKTLNPCTSVASTDLRTVGTVMVSEMGQPVCLPRAKVSLPATAMMKANDEDVQISSSTARVPAPQRRNMVADDGSEEMMDSVCACSFAHPAHVGGRTSCCGGLAVCRLCWPSRVNDDSLLSFLLEQGLTAPVWTNLSQRGEVRTVAVSRTDYFIYI